MSRRDRISNLVASVLLRGSTLLGKGEMLTDGGTVETKYNEYNEAVEATILDDEGVVLSRITYTYDAEGRLSQES